MAPSLRTVGRIVAALLTIALVETGVFGIPESIARQSAFLAFLNEYVPARVSLAVVLALLMAAAAVGPSTLRSWRDSLSDWWNANALLQAESERLKKEKEELNESLEAYEGRNAPKLVARAENPGPVILNPQEPGHHFGFNSWHDKGAQRHRDILIVPYKFNDGEDTSTAEPAATIEVEDVEDIFVVAFSYEVSSAQELLGLRPSRGHEVWLEASDANNVLVKRITVSPEHGPAARTVRPEDALKNFVAAFSGSPSEVPVTWENSVSSSCHLHDLPRGTYGLTLKEELERDYGAREYRNMRLTVRKL